MWMRRASLHGGDIGKSLVLVLAGSRDAVCCTRPQRVVLGPSDRVTSCFGYHADHWELQLYLWLAKHKEGRQSQSTRD
jgi:hypothetical protein